MSTVYLAIGTPKTGTTALQSFMRINEAKLNEQGYAYPLMDLGMPDTYRNRNGQFLIYNPTKRNETEQQKADRMEKAFQQLAEAALTYPNIILSDEQLWYRSRNRESFWADTLEEFHRIGCEIKVVVYLRRQDLLYQSLWNQRIKVWRMSVDTFQEAIKKNSFQEFCFDYYENLEHIAKYVGKENMIVRPYERGQFEEQDIFQDFFSCVGLKLTEDFQREGVAKNMGLEGNYLEIKRMMNSIPEYRELNDFLFRSVLYGSMWCTERGENKKANMLSYEDRMDYLSRYEEGNAKIAREYLGREDGVLFREVIREEPVWTLNQESMSRDIIAVMTEFACAQEKKIRSLEERLKVQEERIAVLESESVIRRIRNKLSHKPEA